MHDRDTIAAIATAPGAGGVGIVRVSGPAAARIAEAMLATVPRPRHAHYARFGDAAGATIDDGLALYFPAPHSYTGEDVLELQAHGSPFALRALLARVCELGARPARAGEFSERAFLNGKLDLAQAEAVADLIAAGSDAAARAARRSLDGVFSRRVEALVTALTELRIWVEAAIDFPEEEIDFLASAELAQRLHQVEAMQTTLLADAERGQRLIDGLHVVIVGPPNAGKSSLLNALAGRERAIVTDLPGTTRDVLREALTLDGIALTLVDTAGLRASDDAIEREGMRRARAELVTADLVLVMLDARRAEHDRAGLADDLAAAAQILWLHNKCDLSGDAPRRERRADGLHLWLSARTGAGLEHLLAALHDAAGHGEGSAGGFSARARHVTALRVGGEHLARARERLLHDHAGELAAEELRLAQDALGEITGRVSSDALLGRIFAGFCIGK